MSSYSYRFKAYETGRQLVEEGLRVRISQRAVYAAVQIGRET